jgi:hypothetical protein
MFIMDCLQISFDIILIILGLYLAFGKSYFSEKGKNLATKEDIGIITNEIETVKNNIISSIQRKTEFLKEKKEAGLIFCDTASFYIDCSLKIIDIVAYNNNNIDIILKKAEDINTQGAKLISAFLKLYVYYNEKTFTDSAENYYNATVKVQKITLGLLFQLEEIAKRENIHKVSLTNGNLNANSDLLALVKEREKLIDDYLKENPKILQNEVYGMRGIYISELSKIVKKEE